MHPDAVATKCAPDVYGQTLNLLSGNTHPSSSSWSSSCLTSATSDLLHRFSLSEYSTPLCYTGSWGPSVINYSNFI